MTRRKFHYYRLPLQERKAARESSRKAIMRRDQEFFQQLFQERLHMMPSPACSILDFGCGAGEMVTYLRGLGYDAHGCDLYAGWDASNGIATEYLKLIQTDPYRFPFDDDCFNAVISTSVLEHAQNPEECFREIYRVLKPGGIAVHLFPGKWYLPAEPHILIPLLNWFWPNCPAWWIRFWVTLRAALIPQLRASRDDQVRTYVDFCKHGIHYITNKRYHRLAMDIFGNQESLMDFYLAHSTGGYARLARKLPAKRFMAWMGSQVRMNFIAHRKGQGTSSE